MNTLLWNIVPFFALLVITGCLYLSYKRAAWWRVPTLLGLMLCYLYLPIVGLVWGYILLSAWLGYGWAFAIYLIFWMFPWIGRVPPLKILFLLPIEAAKNFSHAKMDAWGFIRFEGLAGNSIFVAVGKDERKALAEMLKQIKPQLREQVKNPIRRWFLLHWRWYDPLVGGYCTNKDVTGVLDDAIHNVYGFPISRIIGISAPTPFAGVTITEIN
jgi:hypothetical protein